jgi:hypothetical protein
VVGHTLISPNKGVSARESAQKRVFLAFLLTVYSLTNTLLLEILIFKIVMSGTYLQDIQGLVT